MAPVFCWEGKMNMNLKFILLFTGALLFLFLNAGHTMWAELSERELVERSDVIIQGTYMESKVIHVDHEYISIGIVKSDEVLKGTHKIDTYMIVVPAKGTLVKSDDIHFKAGQKGYWFLRHVKTGGGMIIYAADHPQRFLDLKSASSKIDIIKVIIGSEK